MHLAAAVNAHRSQHVSFALQTMQAHAAEQHQNLITYSVMDVTALGLQVQKSQADACSN